MHTSSLPPIAILPFVLLVLAIAVLPVAAPRVWEKRISQVVVSAACALPIVALLLSHGGASQLYRLTGTYVSFVITIGALYTIAGGIYLNGDLEAKPLTNVAFLVIGAMLASVVGTTGASVLMIRPLLRTNAQRTQKAHLVPLFILAVANAGGLLTPLGDPPLLVGYLNGVPFAWTMRLLPVWLLYVGSFALILYVLDSRAYAREPSAAKVRDHAEVVPVGIRGARNFAWFVALVGAALLGPGWREVAMLTIAGLSYLGTSKEIRALNSFGFGPILEVAILFAGLFVCLAPLETTLAVSAPTLPIQKSWQLFWGSGVLSAVLDNAPTYAAFAALAKGLSHGASELVAGIHPVKLAAISIGSVVMGGTTYIGNGPNLIVKAIAEAHEYRMPSFGRYAAFAIAAMLPAHFIATIALFVMDP